MKSAVQIIAQHLADYAVDEPTGEEWRDFVTAAERVLTDLNAEGYLVCSSGQAMGNALNDAARSLLANAGQFPGLRWHD